eukprot:TRINITY_DN56916_c0_g1_i1.p1 TRINITY_DN56916_c0_g1~~TRINITY_DN56916_c0_g1_i1.p1  ORF type:complete len:132 (-),score=20.30 TRINITY_DN56916_c0_g1_i1:41-436(-)
MCFFFFFQAEDGIRDAQESRGLGDVYKRQLPFLTCRTSSTDPALTEPFTNDVMDVGMLMHQVPFHSIISHAGKPGGFSSTCVYSCGKVELPPFLRRSKGRHVSTTVEDTSGVLCISPVSYTHLTLPTKRIV